MSEHLFSTRSFVCDKNDVSYSFCQIFEKRKLVNHKNCTAFFTGPYYYSYCLKYMAIWHNHITFLVLELVWFISICHRFFLNLYFCFRYLDGTFNVVPTPSLYSTFFHLCLCQEWGIHQAGLLGFILMSGKCKKDYKKLYRKR